jgi:hypothetical protein
MQKSFIILLFSLGIFIIGCKENSNNNTSRAFYYWKTIFSISSEQKKMLAELKVKKLYVKFFDVNLNDSLNPQPVASICFKSPIPEGIKMIPVVYITNKIFSGIDSTEVKDLADKISVRVLKLIPQGFQIKELQIDCDWTEQTKSKYFSLLLEIKRNFPGILIASTIRLHQVKYYKRTGIPPVDRGMLMFYNMGSLTDRSTNNSIFDKDVAKRYLYNFDSYPLKLDIVLPVFSWAVLNRNGSGTRLLSNFSIDEVMRKKLEDLKENSYLVKEDFNYHGFSFLPGDMLRIENIGPEETEEAARLIEPYLKDDSISVALFDLNEINLKKYKPHDLEKIFSIFN